jgi:rsbT antagonist protein RsbS
MEEEFSSSGITMHIVMNCLVVPLNLELYDGRVIKLQEEVLDTLKNEKDVKGVIIDFSSVNTLDSFLGKVIQEIAKISSFMGTETVLSGIRPEVALSMVELNIDFEGINTALNIEDAFHKIKPLSKSLSKNVNNKKSKKI